MYEDRHEKINMIWGSRSCHHFIKMMLCVSQEEEATSRSQETAAPCCGVIGDNTCELQEHR